MLESLKELEFDNFIKPLEKDLDAFRKVSMDKKKEIKAKKDAAKATASNSANTSEVIDITEEG